MWTCLQNLSIWLRYLHSIVLSQTSIALSHWKEPLIPPANDHKIYKPLLCLAKNWLYIAEDQNVSQLQGSWLKVTPNNWSAGFITIEGNASGTCLVVFPLNTISQVLLWLSFILLLQAYCWIFPTSFIAVTLPQFLN